MQTKIYSDASVFTDLAAEWDDLVERSVHAPFFMRLIYQRNWWHYLGRGDLRVVTVRTEAGKLVGIAPLFAETNSGRRQLSFVGCVAVSDYLDLLVDESYIDEVHQALLDLLTGDTVAWDILYLCSLPQKSITYTRLAEAARERGWAVEIEEQDVCPVITLANEWDDYLAGIDKKQRHEIRRKIRKIHRESEAEWYFLDSAEGLEAAIETFIDLHQKSTQDKEDFWDDSLIAFFKNLAVDVAETGWLKLYFIKVNGVEAAAMLCFDYNNEFLLYNSGYDPEGYASLSPGNVLASYTIQHAIELGRSRYDFLRGDETYKLRFGAEPEPVYDVTIRRGG